jgi:cytochrome c5
MSKSQIATATKSWTLLLVIFFAACQNQTTQTKPTGFVLTQEQLPEYEANIDHARLIGEADDEAYFRGMKTYIAVCFTCHGNQEHEGSLPTANKFWQDTFKVGKDPYSMYQTLSRGYGLMPPQVQLSPREKYDVIRYLRAEFLEEKNPKQFFELTDEYLASLPEGDTIGPPAVTRQPWKDMDYGDFWINTYELASTNSPPRNMSRRNAPLKDEDWSWANWAYKGIAVRLDRGEGGITKGKSWMIFDHDLLRVAGGWSGEEFIDYAEILMDGQHNISPRTAGELHFSNPVSPGWANPETGRFDDPRFTARDGRQFGPLPKSWGRLKGIYHHEQKVIVSYYVGVAEILEMLSVEYDGERPVYVRNLHIQDAYPLLLAHIAPEANGVVLKGEGARVFRKDGQHYLRFHDSGAFKLKILIAESAGGLAEFAQKSNEPIDLEQFTQGGKAHYPEVLTTQLTTKSSGPFAVDFLTSPVNNPWKSRLRMGGLDFFADKNKAVAVCTEGDVWTVEGLLDDEGELEWRRIGSGLFQPLGVKVIDEQIYITCRDQLVRLHDLNGDGETDYYESFNNDHQVTDHFHEFAMGLQADEEGNFYYAKSGRHAREALVPQHGTLIKVSRDGSSSAVIAYGFRAANGVCLNPDGSFIVTDQEGFWNPMNRVNWVDKNDFYGNMWCYNPPADSSDEAMVPPLTWVDSKVDRSPAELLWVDSEKWGPLNGSLLNLSYGYGTVYLIPHEKVNGQVQGGIYQLPIPAFKTGLIRGRFNPGDGQLYVCGMSAWATNQVFEPGGFFRIRYNGEALHAPVALHALQSGMQIVFSDPLDPESVRQENFTVKTWDLKRTRRYGSKHYNEKELSITAAELGADGRTVMLRLPAIEKTWQMEIRYELKGADGEAVQGQLQNTIHHLADEESLTMR